MPGVGTLINCILIVLGGLAGLFIGKGIKERLQNILKEGTALPFCYPCLLYFLFQTVKFFGGEKPAQGNIQSVAELFNRRYGDVSVLRVKDTVYGRRSTAGERCNLVHLYIALFAYILKTFCDRILN